MKRTPVSSSNIFSIGYDEDSQILEIEFQYWVYQYFDVPMSTYEWLMNAGSHGKYFIAHIKEHFNYKKI